MRQVSLAKLGGVQPFYGTSVIWPTATPLAVSFSFIPLPDLTLYVAAVQPEKAPLPIELSGGLVQDEKSNPLTPLQSLKAA